MSLAVETRPENDREAPETHVLDVGCSVSTRRWLLRPRREETAREMVSHHGLVPLLAQILAAREVAPETCVDFLDPKLKTMLPDPYTLTGMKEAAERTMQALLTNEPIAVFCDYDADGATSAAVIKRYMTSLARPLALHVPDRLLDGHGLNTPALDKMKAEGTKLLLAVDCGSSDMEALAHAHAIGLDVVVLDHHAVETRAPDTCIVNPNAPDDTSGLGMLSGVGVSFLFLVALNRVLRAQGFFSEMDEPDLLSLLDLVALGTVCDVAPLIGVNRAFVAAGLKVLEQRRNKGLAALCDAARLRGMPDAETLSFALGPRINAAGRIGGGALSVDILTCDDAEEAAKMAGALDTLNRQRRTIEAAVLAEATAQIEASATSATQDAPLIFAAGEGWHPGVVGIVAGRLKDRYDRPAVIVALDENGAGTGSGRSMPGVDLGALIRQAEAEGVVRRGGGHAMAAGFSFDAGGAARFARFLTEGIRRATNRPPEMPSLAIDAVLAASGLTPELYASLARAAPFGQGHPNPRFALAHLRLSYTREMRGGHIRCLFTAEDGTKVSAIVFRARTLPLGRALSEGAQELFHIAGRLRPAYNGRGRVEIHIEDAAHASGLK